MSGEQWPFVAREDEQERFAAALTQIQAGTADDAQSPILLIEALGGYGKTTLRRRLGQLARGEIRHATMPRPRFRVVEVDWEEQRDRRPELSLAFGPRLLPVLLTLHGELLEGARRGSRVQAEFMRAFKSFSERAARAPEFAATAEKIAADRVAAERNREQRLDAIAAIGTTLTAASPAAPVAPAAAAISPFLKIFKRPRSSSLSSATGVDESFRYEEALVRSFAEGLRAMSKTMPVVFLLDTYEIAAGVGPWLRQATQHSGGRVLWVFAGRLGGDGPNDDFSEAAAFRREVPEDHLRVITLAKFSDATTRRLLAESTVPVLPAEMLGQAAEVTRGIPLAVQLVARALGHGGNPDEVLRPLTKQGTSAYVVRELARRYLVHVRNDPELAPDLPLLYGLALLHGDRSDPAVLEALWDRPEPISQILDHLARRHDFVGFESQRLHQEIESTLREYLLDSARRAEVRRANERARDALLSRLQGRGPEMLEVLADALLRYVFLAVVWHSFWIDNDEGFRALLEALPPALLLEPDAARDLLQTASFFKGDFTMQQERLMRGFASMLTFGSFVDGWLARRSSSPDLGTPAGYLGRIREQAQKQDRVYAEEALIAAGEEATWLGQTAEVKRGAVTVLLDADGDPVDWLARLEEASAIWPREGKTGSAFSAAATASRSALLSGGASADLLRRAAVVDEGFEPASGSGRVLVGMVAALIDRGDAGSANRILDRVGEMYAGHAIVLADYAAWLRRAGKLEASEHMYQLAIRADPANFRILASQATELWKEGRLNEAADCFERALELEPISAYLLADLAFVLRDAGRAREAEAAFDRAIAAEPTGAHELGNLAIYLSLAGRFEESREMFEKALVADPKHANNMVAYAALLADDGQRTKADELFDRALKSVPTDPGVLGNIASYLNDTGRPAEAQEVYAQALEQDPTHPRNLVVYAAFLAERDDDKFPVVAQQALEHVGEMRVFELILHFCLWARGPLADRPTHAAASRDLLSAGVQTAWDPSPLMKEVERAKHPEMELLREAAGRLGHPPTRTP